MSQASERTRLLATDENKPQYVHNSEFLKDREKRLKQFQCCMCIIFICATFIALVVSISLSIRFAYNIPNDSENLTDSFLVLSTQNWPIFDKPISNVTCNNSTELKQALEAGQNALDKKDLLEKSTPILPIDSPSYKHQRVTSTSTKAISLARIGYLQEHASKFFRSNKNGTLPHKVCYKVLDNNTWTSNFCEDKNVSCNIFYKYRSYDGSCNNLKHSQTYGKAFQPFRRALPPDYSDGISNPRVSKSGMPLPSARTVSMTVHRSNYKDDPKFSVMLAVWGQFLDHDITATALSKIANGSSISCCSSSGNLHPECFPVILDQGDPLQKNNVNCMEFVRSAPTPTCCFGPREQLNQASSFIDGSVIYGVDEKTATGLRTLNDGLLKMYITEDNRTLLPISEDMNDGCNREDVRQKGRYCFATGDSRANENLHLTSMHLLWARQHNKLAKNLSNINPHWNDERIFQETRRIIGSQIQHIAYNEFLPILLGPVLMKKFNLYPNKTGHFKNYNDSINPSIGNNFASAAFRFAHTLIPSVMKMLSKNNSTTEYIQMHQMLFNPFKLYIPGEMDRALRGAVDTNIEASDPYFNDEIKQHLFETVDINQLNGTKKSGGLDLVSLNIQRGRDHGLPGYIKWREHCGLSTAQNFSHIKDIDPESLKRIQTIYRDLEDIDLYTGALSEIPLNGSILGPTLTCLILDQFIRLKHGDRFWYENKGQFTLEELKEIHNTSLAKIICDNSDDIENIQPLVMEKIRKGNEITPCTDLPEMNLSLWKSNNSFHNISIPGDQIKVSVNTVRTT